jgi:hypothetical protein
MFFSFAESHRPVKKAAGREKPKVARNVLKMPAPAQVAPDPAKTQLESVTEMCRMLHKLAAKYIPRTAFDDFEYLVQGTKVLQELQVPLTVAENLQAPVAEHNSAVVLHAPQYRLLRNRALAALATIADLSSKTPAKGSGEYQKGMRDGFDYASDIAIFFLEDMEAAFSFRR